MSILRSRVLNSKDFKNFKNFKINFFGNFKNLRFNSSIPNFVPKEYHYVDYPKIKAINYQKRDPYLKYDDQQNRRNFNEPLHPNADALDMWSPDYFDFISDRVGIRWFLTLFAVIGAGSGIIYFGNFYPDRPVYPRTYPHGGLAKDLGSRTDEDAHLYAARIDKAD
ncbi:hypothetical protein PACTADRAFT_48607 [Pachysolen tannophilus NRRL Y-2460]|uniref:NADH dehydrogenase [ubiquinone] 1 beta subcomplex subunit 8, mitochondrial n=1 Tax=Pachysolen tannophilus NRRL Y-2460 TaxID=669874 RepID=A0A1E4TYF8_PACTA|nr:hypothetical protein PACTADRAFT_48607 [Pachysolen tannophilus NRRL Y-2460]